MSKKPNKWLTHPWIHWPQPHNEKSTSSGNTWTVMFLVWSETYNHQLPPLHPHTTSNWILRRVVCIEYIFLDPINTSSPLPGPNPCELRCEARTEKLVYGFGKASDGTPCPLGVCLDGRCLVGRSFLWQTITGWGFKGSRLLYKYLRMRKLNCFFGIILLETGFCWYDGCLES